MGGREQFEEQLASVAHLRALSQEALTAAAMIGTTEQELAAARQMHHTAEHLWQQAHETSEAAPPQRRWEALQAAATAYRQAEESAVRAGLGHIERELAQAYALLPASKVQPSQAYGRARVAPRNLDLHRGAGATFPVVGKAQRGEVLDILEEAGDWYRVRTEQGVIGWVSKIMVTRVR
jgi:uncharacterized protein YgiM (DUF1202 family)